MTHQFEKHYTVYSSLKEGFEKVEYPFNFGFYRLFKEGENIRDGDIIEREGAYYLVKGMCALFGRKGYRFYKEKLILGSRKECCCGKKQPHKKCFYHSGKFSPDFLVFDEPFFNYVFQLPLEYHNSAVNKFVLKNVEEPYWVLNLLINEYRNKGRHFEEYFSCLSPKRKWEIVDGLSSSGNRNNAKINFFIWKQGFNIPLEHMVLYKESSEDFRRYFENIDDSEKKVILNDLLNSDFINEKVIDWLNENYSDLMREVSFS